MLSHFLLVKIVSAFYIGCLNNSSFFANLVFLLYSRIELKLTPEYHRVSVSFNSLEICTKTFSSALVLHMYKLSHVRAFVSSFCSRQRHEAVGTQLSSRLRGPV